MKTFAEETLARAKRARIIALTSLVISLLGLAISVAHNLKHHP